MKLFRSNPFHTRESRRENHVNRAKTSLFWKSTTYHFSQRTPYQWIKSGDSHRHLSMSSGYQPQINDPEDGDQDRGVGVPGGPASGSGVSHGDLVNNGVSGSYYGSSVGDTGHHGDHPDLTGGSSAKGNTSGVVDVSHSGVADAIHQNDHDRDDEDEDDDGRPKILLMGLRRSGKSSIQRVVFHKMSPNETLFLESTNAIHKENVSNSSFVQFAVWDFPGQIDFFDPEIYDGDSLFMGTGAVIFVIDAQDDYVEMEAIQKLTLTVTRAFKANPGLHFEVFIHKVDSLSDDTRMETQRDIHQRVQDELQDAGLENVIDLSFYLTSIYDHSIFEAFSKVVQKLIPQLPTLENMLNMFVQHSNAEKAFLFDVVSKIYIATDSSPVDMQSYELCCDMIDLVIDVSCIYGLATEIDSSSFDEKSGSLVRLNNNTVLYLREIDRVLALVCILREENYPRPPDSIYPTVPFEEIRPSNVAVIELNTASLRKGIKQVFEVGAHFRRLKREDQQQMTMMRNGGSPGTAVNGVVDGSHHESIRV